MAEPRIRTFRGDRPVDFVHTLEAQEGVSVVVWLAGVNQNNVQTVFAESVLHPNARAATRVEPPFRLALVVRYFISGPPAARFFLRTEMSQEGSERETHDTEGLLDQSGHTDLWGLIVADRRVLRDGTSLEYISRLWIPKLRLREHRSSYASEDVYVSEEVYASGAPSEPKQRPTRDIHDYTVWFGTNRTPKVRGERVVDFASHRSEVVRFGRCRVSIPESHKIGSLGGSLWTRIRTGVDDRLKVAKVTTMPAETHWTEIRAALSTVLESERDAVVFLHGYNTTFKNAALRAAQLGADLGISGVMAFYSWPSKGALRSYAADAASIEASEGAITDYLTTVASVSEAKKIHIIAHSMGNRALLRAVNRIATTASARSGRHFNQIILAAADVDAGVFRSLSAAYGTVADRTTMYVGPGDMALKMSSFLHSFPRVGFTPPVMVVPGVDTVSVENLDLMGLGHGYVSEMRELLSDIHALLKNGTSPNKRFGLQPATCPAGSYWVMAR